jgi:hypothetical protein
MDIRTITEKKAAMLDWVIKTIQHSHAKTIEIDTLDEILPTSDLIKRDKEIIRIYNLINNK